MPEFSLANAPAAARHRRLALAVVAATLVANAAVIPFATVRLPEVDSFVPSVFSVIFVADLVTAVLLFSQFAATGLRPLLALACGYLFSSLIVVGHMLTFPGAFSPSGLLGAGPQSAAWLNILWRFGLPVAFAAYAVLKLRDQPPDAHRWAPRSAIFWSVAIIATTVGLLIFAVTAGHDLMPHVMANGHTLLLGRFLNGINLAVDLVVLILLAQTRAKSVLDVWLTAAAVTMLAESLMIVSFIQERYTLGFYAIRLIWLPVSKVVLIALLWETMRLHANLSVSIRQLRQERADRLANAATLMAAVSHEVRQPLASIGLLAYGGQKSLERPAQDLGSANKLLGETSNVLREIREAASRANEVFDTFLKLVRGGRRELQAVDLNALTLEAIGLLKNDLDEHNVTIATKLAPDLPAIQAHKGQIREVVLNLIQNAIEAMAPVAGNPRLIGIETSCLGRGAVSISLQDTGPGITPEKLANLFEPFATTKKGGTGLGLAICRMIVDQHDGRLLVENDENGGAKFTIQLPTGRPAPVVAASGERNDVVEA